MSFFYVLMIILLPEEAQETRNDSPHQNEMVVGRDQVVQWKKSQLSIHSTNDLD